MVEIGYPGEIWAVDTFYLPSIKFSNNQITTALICKDIASHYIFCRPVRSKKSEDMTKAFLSIIAENHGRSPRKIFSDAGSELNCISKSLSELEIIRYSVKNKDIKTGPIENAVLQVKRGLFRAMYYEGTLRWIDLLPKIVYSLNHRHTKNLFNFCPADLHDNPKNFDIYKKLWLKQKLKYESEFRNKKSDFKVGDIVKIKKPRTVFTRGFTEKYSPETHILTFQYDTYPRVWEIDNDSKGKKYYEKEIVHASPIAPVYYLAATDRNEMTLKNGKKKLLGQRYLIKDLNSPSYSKWLDEIEFQEIRKNKNFHEKRKK